MRVLIVSPEIVPFAKTGGLADVAGALPIALSELKIDTRAVMPKYKAVDSAKFKLCRKTEIIFESTFPGTGIPVYFVQNDEFFNRDGLYQKDGRDFEDNLERFSFFCKTVLESLKSLEYKPDIIHCNDWQTGLILVYLKTIYKDDPFFQGIKTVFTIHNLAYQGLFNKEKFPLTGLDWSEFIPDKLEYYDKLSLIKGGLVYADILTTVSPTYSKEIQTKEQGFGMEGLLASRSKDLVGILNGVDYSEWSPENDKYIAQRYSKGSLEGKLLCKQALQKENNLPVKDAPLIGIISRLTDQKGFDIFALSIEKIMRQELQFVILGTGEPRYHKLLQGLQVKYPKKMALHLTFDNAMAHRIEAGSDMFLMPSKFEPCGLNQLYSLKYGTIPIVRKTGGLADTVIDGITGFVFEQYSDSALLETIKRACKTYQDKPAWQRLIINAMSKDFSWRSSCQTYRELYTKLINY